MPGLNENQLVKLKQQLQARFAELKETVRQELLRTDDERYLELAGRVHDTGDEAVADLLSDINLAVVDQHVREIQDIENALLRMGEGRYGICIDCDEEIGYKRLHAYPTAKRCHGCQVKHEKDFAQPSHPAL
jgi:RNA polymerase-binding protein DksA